MPDELIGLPAPEPDQPNDPQTENKSNSNPHADPTAPNPREPENHSGSRAGTPRRQIPSTEDCLLKLNDLVGLTALGLVRPGQANAMRGALQTILNFHQRAEVGVQASAQLDLVQLEQLRQNPELMAIFEPILTDAQVAALMRDTTDGDRSEPKT